MLLANIDDNWKRRMKGVKMAEPAEVLAAKPKGQSVLKLSLWNVSLLTPVVL